MLLHWKNKFGTAAAGIFAMVAFAGCTGVALENEKAARAQLQSVPAVPRAALPVLTTNSTLADFTRYAALNQPSVRAAYFDWAASVERITTARSLPDPQLTFQMDIENVVTSLMPGFLMNFPGPGKLRAGADVAAAETQARYFAFQSAILETAWNLKQSYYQLFFLEEKIRVSRETLRLLADLEREARVQNDIGKATLQDVLRAQIEQDRLTTDITNLIDSRASLLAQFRAALGTQAGEPDPPVPAKFESTPLDTPSDQLFSTALSLNPRLKSMEADVRAAEAAIALASKAGVPDYSLGLMADAKTAPTLYRPLATMSLPIWRDKIAAQIAEAWHNKHAAEARLSAEQISLAVDFAEAAYDLREDERNLNLLRQRLLPKAGQSLSIARTAYQSGQSDFFNLIDTERTLLGFQLEEVDLRTRREIVLARLALLVLGQTPDSAPVSVPTKK